MNPGPKELSIKQEVLTKCWTYLRDNFHKFSETNQIKIALALAAKDLPTEISGSLDGKVVMMPTIEKGGQTMEFKIGSSPPASATD